MQVEVLQERVGEDIAAAADEIVVLRRQLHESRSQGAALEQQLNTIADSSEADSVLRLQSILIQCSELQQEVALLARQRDDAIADSEVCVLTVFVLAVIHKYVFR